MMNTSIRFGQLDKNTLADQIVSRLKDLIMSGELRPGARLPTEIDLCNQFGVGRTTVREALKALVLIGLLVRSNSGTYVSTKAQEKVLDTYASYVYSRESTIVNVYEARRILEIELVALAAERATEEDILKLRQIVERSKRLGPLELSRHLITDLEFHLAVAEAARNPVLFELYVVVCEIMKKAFANVYTKLSPSVFEDGMRNHNALLSAIQKHDVQEARREIERSLDEAEQLLTAL